MTGSRIRIVVKGRVGPNVRSVLAGLEAEVIPRHEMFVVGAGGFPELMAALESLNQRGVEVDRISRLVRSVDCPMRTESPRGGHPAG